VCSIGKARQKNINKNWKCGSSVPEERLYVDISSIRGVSSEKGRFIAFDLKTRVRQPSDATKYKNYTRKFKEGNPQEWIDMLRGLELLGNA
jgi:hypothetical protein